VESLVYNIVNEENLGTCGFDRNETAEILCHVDL